MSSRFGAIFAQEAAALRAAPGYFRIAIPSWRFVGIRVEKRDNDAPAALSREEMQALFDGELNPRRTRRAKLTEFEEREKALQQRIRDALYDPPVPAASPRRA
jgi:hypothetical protein